MSRNRLKTIFFDAMGTVIDLKAWVIAMINEFTIMSKRHNVAFEDVSGAWDTEWRKVNKEIRKVKSKPFQSIRELFHEAFMRVGKRLKLQLKEQDIAGSIERTYDYVNKHAETFPDVPKTLEALKKEGYKIGIISDADTKDLTLQLRSAGILGYFDLMTTSSDVKSYKPNTKIFEIALAKANCKASQSCHIGDTPEFDVMGANRAGVPSILVTHGKKKVNWRSAKPTYVIHELSELMSILHKFQKPLVE